MEYHSLIYKPKEQSLKDFNDHVRMVLGPISNVGNLVPHLVSKEKDIYFIKAVTKDPKELGFNTVFPLIDHNEWLELKTDILNGNLEVLDYKNNLIYEDKFLLEAKAQVIIPDLNDINLELINYLSVHPELLQELHWRKFEELLATLFKAKGYETELGPGSGDGGVDIRMVSSSDVEGSFLTLVQAKRYATHRKITLEPVQALYGVLASENASKGLFVTTSSYLPCAINFAKSNPYRLQLAGKSEICTWLKEYQRL